MKAPKLYSLAVSNSCLMSCCDQNKLSQASDYKTRIVEADKIGFLTKEDLATCEESGVLQSPGEIFQDQSRLMGNIGRKLEEDMDKKTMHQVPGISLLQKIFQVPPRRAFISQLPMTLGLVDYALSTKIDQMKKFLRLQCKPGNCVLFLPTVVIFKCRAYFFYGCFF